MIRGFIFSPLVVIIRLIPSEVTCLKIISQSGCTNGSPPAIAISRTPISASSEITSIIRNVGNSVDLSTCGDEDVMQCKHFKLHSFEGSKYTFNGASGKNEGDV